MNVENSLVIEDFFGVYLLYCINPKFKGRTYIGYTRDPSRRIKQHNRGTWAGGACRTNNKGPWKMVLIVHGFPNNIAALRFEWAWQNPNKTTRLQHLNLKKIPRKESEFQFQLRVLNEMLHVGPWLRLPLTVQWLEKEFFSEFSSSTSPPAHVPTVQGSIKSKNLKKTLAEQIQTECLICSQYIVSSNTKLTCLNENCELVCHITCLSTLFLEPGEFVPVQGTCPFCDTNVRWGDLTRKMKGCKTDMVCDDGDSDNEDVGFCSQDAGFVDNNSRWLDECEK